MEVKTRGKEINVRKRREEKVKKNERGRTL